MNYIVFEEGKPVGEINIEAAGLYYEIRAKVKECGRVQRLYGVRGEQIFCIGVPDSKGELIRRISKRAFVVPDRVILSEVPPQREEPIPEIEELLSVSQDNIIEDRKRIEERSYYEEYHETDDQKPLTETEDGGEKNEIHNQSCSDDIDPLLFADLPADYDYGGAGAEEADSDYH